MEQVRSAAERKRMELAAKLHAKMLARKEIIRLRNEAEKAKVAAL